MHGEAPRARAKDIDYLEVQRGSYEADQGDRTYGVFNVIPRTGFERTDQAELIGSAGNLLNLSNQHLLLDNSLTFGGFHYNNPREIYGELHYRFGY